MKARRRVLDAHDSTPTIRTNLPCPELTRETAARIPGAEAIVMDGIGHFPMSENPDRFATFLLPVLNRIAMA